VHAKAIDLDQSFKLNTRIFQTVWFCLESWYTQHEWNMQSPSVRTDSEIDIRLHLAKLHVRACSPASSPRPGPK
jgi:hypothetical protein